MSLKLFKLKNWLANMTQICELLVRTYDAGVRISMCKLRGKKINYQETKN